MDTAALAALLVAGVVALTPLSDRLRVPQPVLLTVFGLALALVPGTPQLAIEPSLVLPLVLPPLLFAATQRTTVREFRAHARPVLLMAVGLTLATIVVVAVVAHALGLSWEIAWVLGAIVSPPDPVAATAVARGLHLPHRLVTILEGRACSTTRRPSSPSRWPSPPPSPAASRSAGRWRRRPCPSGSASPSGWPSAGSPPGSCGSSTTARPRRR